MILERQAIQFKSKVVGSLERLTAMPKTMRFKDLKRGQRTFRPTGVPNDTVHNIHVRSHFPPRRLTRRLARRSHISSRAAQIIPHPA